MFGWPSAHAVRSGRALIGASAALVSLAALVAPAQANQRDATCFGETPTVEVIYPTTVGTEGDDVILGGERVYGLGGDDKICDASWISGGPGADKLRLLNGGTARGDTGNDELVAVADDLSASGAVLNGGRGRDVFWGSTGDDVIFGGSGRDVARGNGGDDLIDLGSGNDVGYGQDGDDTLLGFGGRDTLDGGEGYDTADGGPGRDRCTAESRVNC